MILLPYIPLTVLNEQGDVDVSFRTVFLTLIGFCFIVYVAISIITWVADYKDISLVEFFKLQWAYIRKLRLR